MLVIALAGAIALLLSAAALASDAPPPSGDWTVGTGEDVHCRDALLELHGDLEVLGDLDLDNCTLMVWSTSIRTSVITVREGGELSVRTSQVFPGDANAPYVIRTEPGSALSFSGGAIVGAGRSLLGDGEDSGIFMRADATFEGVHIEGCLVGLWAEGSSVVASGCDFLSCDMGAFARGGGRLRLAECSFDGCQFGGKTTEGEINSSGCSFDLCPYPLWVERGPLTLIGATFRSFGRTALTVYNASLAMVEGCTFLGGANEGVFAFNTSLSLSDSDFTGCGEDVHVERSWLTATGTRHHGSVDSAFYARESMLDLTGVRTYGSYSALCTLRSSGRCRDLASENATLGVFIDRGEHMILDGLSLNLSDGGPEHLPSRGLWVQTCDAQVSDVTVRGGRTGIQLDSVKGKVEDLAVSGCAQEGVSVTGVGPLAMRGVVVTGCSDGFLLDHCTGVVLEDCTARECTAAGFRFRTDARARLVGCNATGCPLGMSIFAASPVLEGCTWYMVAPNGTVLEDAIGLDCLLGGPSIEGGTVTGGQFGMLFNGSRARIEGVTFLGTLGECIAFTDSAGDSVSGCRLLGARNAVGVLAVGSTPVLRGNLARGVLTAVMALFDRSHPVLEGNTFEDLGSDGVVVLANASADLSGNVIARCGGSALRVGIHSRATSSGDRLSSCAAALVYVHTGSAFDIEGAELRNATIGIHGYDGPYINVSFCRFIDLGRGMVAEKIPGPSSQAPRLEVLVSGCHFTNNTAYCVGVVNGAARVLRCSMIGNGGGVGGWNSTVELLDPIMVGNTVWGLMVDNGTAAWECQGLCRVIGSPIMGRVRITVNAGELSIEDTKVDMDPGGGLDARGSSVLLRNVLWLAWGTQFTATCCTVSLTGVSFEGVGSAEGSGEGASGVVLSGSTLVATGSTFHKAWLGLSLETCDASLDGCLITDCQWLGLSAVSSRIVLTRCSIAGFPAGKAVELAGSHMVADNTSIGIATTVLELSDGTARLVDCTLGGGSLASVDVTAGHVTFVNTTHEAENDLLGPGGTMETWWYLSAVVGWVNRSELASIEVWVEDASGARVAGALADDRGRVDRMVVLAAESGEGGEVLHGPHLVSARIHDYTTRATVTLQSSVTVELSLLDPDPPVVVVVSPAHRESRSATASVALYGLAHDAGSGTARIDVTLDGGVATWSTAGESFFRTLLLSDGRHDLVVLATDRAGNTASASVTVWVDTQPIHILLTGPADGTRTNTTGIELRGYVSKAGVALRVDGALLELDGINFSRAVPLVEGWNVIRVTADDLYGHHAAANLSVFTDLTPPGLLVTSPRLVYTREAWALVEGTTDIGAHLTINGVLVIARDGNFSVRVPVNLGECVLLVVAVDDEGNARSERIVAIRSAPTTEPEGVDTWEVVPFVIVVPLLVLVEWYVIARKRIWGDDRAR